MRQTGRSLARLLRLGLPVAVTLMKLNLKDLKHPENAISESGKSRHCPKAQQDEEFTSQMGPSCVTHVQNDPETEQKWTEIVTLDVFKIV